MISLHVFGKLRHVNYAQNSSGIHGLYTSPTGKGFLGRTIVIASRDGGQLKKDM